MEKEFYFIKMEEDMKDIFKMTSNKEKVFKLIRLVHVLEDYLRMVNEMGLVGLYGKIKKYMMDNGKTD